MVFWRGQLCLLCMLKYGGKYRYGQDRPDYTRHCQGLRMSSNNEIARGSIVCPSQNSADFRTSASRLFRATSISDGTASLFLRCDKANTADFFTSVASSSFARIDAIHRGFIHLALSDRVAFNDPCHQLTLAHPASCVGNLKCHHWNF